MANTGIWGYLAGEAINGADLDNQGALIDNYGAYYQSGGTQLVVTPKPASNKNNIYWVLALIAVSLILIYLIFKNKK